jgi:hypothetical protein
LANRVQLRIPALPQHGKRPKNRPPMRWKRKPGGVRSMACKNLSSAGARSCATTTASHSRFDDFRTPCAGAPQSAPPWALQRPGGGRARHRRRPCRSAGSGTTAGACSSAEGRHLAPGDSAKAGGQQCRLIRGRAWSSRLSRSAGLRLLCFSMGRGWDGTYRRNRPWYRGAAVGAHSTALTTIPTSLARPSWKITARTGGIRSFNVGAKKPSLYRVVGLLSADATGDDFGFLADDTAAPAEIDRPPVLPARVNRTGFPGGKFV